jgi:DNA-binding response OmpR family regulator
MTNRRILLVEDDPLLGVLLSDNFAEYGYSVDLTDNLKTACGLELNNDYDGIIMDGDFHYTPEDKINGIVRENAVIDFVGHMVMKNKKDVPIVIISGRTDYSWVGGFVNVDYVIKTKGAGAILVGLEGLLNKTKRKV